MLYRVRKSWEDSGSQLGAYEILDNAIRKCDENPGYAVFDEAGNVIHRSGEVVVQTMSYKAKLVKKVNAAHPKGQSVQVTRDLKKNWVLKDGTIVPDKTYLDLKKQLFDPDCRYSKADAESWINTRGYKSATEWLFWCNKWGQRVYIFKGSKGNWVLQKVYKCGTGMIADGDGGDQGVGFSWKIYDKHKQYQGPRGMVYWGMHYSSPYGNMIHQGGVGKPLTHGCIALAKKQAIWAFENLPVNTKVIVY